jgi:4-amino-4-deoxy-L-arabinose transferase-like glycosyltransferase
MLLSVLRTRRDLRWSLGIGIGLGLLCLTKGAIAALLGAIVLVFIWLDTPRLITSGIVWTGIFIGVLPALAWYGAQGLHYGQTFFTANLMDQAVSRVLTPVEQNRGAPWYYLLEILKYGWPWLLFIPAGCRLAWENRNWSWAKLVLVWAAGYLLVISLMSTKLPWYVLPIYPALALIVGAELSTLWDSADMLGGLRSSKSSHPKLWLIGLSLLAIAGWVGGAVFSAIGPQPKPGLPLILLAAGLTMTVAAVLVVRRNSQFIAILCWGMYVSLLLFVLSPYWVWELGEDYPVKPVANLVRTHTPAQRAVFTSHPYNRPSLNFYSDRVIRPASIEALKQIWKQPNPPFLLISQKVLQQLKLPQIQELDQTGDWLLITRQPEKDATPSAKKGK